MVRFERRRNPISGGGPEGAVEAPFDGGAMRLGLNLGYSGSSIGIDLAPVQEADRLGYHSVWSAEAYGSDAITTLTWVAAHTTRIGVGTAIMQIAARSPALTATTAITLDQLSGGRVLFGISGSG